MWQSKTTKTLWAFPSDVITLDDDITDFGNIFDNFFAEIRGEKVFPPTDVLPVGDGFSIQMALAGYKKSDIHIFEQNDVLVINGKKEDHPAHISTNITAKSFHRSFKLGKSLEVTDAILTDGMLTVTIVRREPEKTKIKKHEIR